MNEMNRFVTMASYERSDSTLKHFTRAHVNPAPFLSLYSTQNKLPWPIHVIQPPPRQGIPSFVGSVFPEE